MYPLWIVFLLLIDCGLEGNLNKEMHTFSKNKKKNTTIMYLFKKKKVWSIFLVTKMKCHLFWTVIYFIRN